MYTVASNFCMEEFRTLEEAKAFARNQYEQIMAHATPADLRASKRDGEMLVIYACSIEELDSMFCAPDPKESWDLF